MGGELVWHIPRDESLVRFAASGWHLVGVPELVLLLCGVYKKAAVAILDTFAWRDSRIPWVLFLSEQSRD